MIINELFQNEPITIASYLSKCGVKDVEEYLYPTGLYIDGWHGYKNIDLAVKEIEYWSKVNNSTIFIICDPDVDGICSTVILYQYLVRLYYDWNIKMLLHTGKQRGLDDEDIMDRIRNEHPDLVIIPDAGSNNVEQAQELCELGIGLIVLDHHEITTPIQFGCLINNQTNSEDMSKAGSGTLVTHKFLQAMDSAFNKNWSSEYIDLVALSLISDSIDMSDMESREYYYYGLENRSWCVNDFLLAMIDKFIGNDSFTQRDIAFKIVPKLNAVMRSKSQEDKQAVLMAFMGCDIEQTLCLIEEAHKNQIKIVDDVVQLHIDQIQELSKNNLIVLASNDIPRSYSGLLAGKIKTMCDDKPVIVGSIQDGYMIGSLRSPIPLRDELDNNELVDFASGHDNSCGVGIDINNIQALVGYYNSHEINYAPHVDVLKSYSIKSIPTRLFGLFEPFKTIWGTNLPEPQFCIKNITFYPSEWSIIGKTKRTLKLHKEGIDIVIFNCLKKDKEDLQLGYYENDCFVYEPSKNKLKMECIGKLGINEWNGKKTYQLIVDKFEISCYNRPCKDDLF